jgi:Ca2+/H+ antiporter
MNKQLQNFFDNTKQLHIFLCVALLLIIVIMVAPIGHGFIKYSGQLIIIMILMYILFKNFTETHNFSLIQKNMENEKIKRNKEKKKKKDNTSDEDTEKEDSDMDEDTRLDLQNNTIASYVLCLFILMLLIYVIYSMFD